MFKLFSYDLEPFTVGNDLVTPEQLVERKDFEFMKTVPTVVDIQNGYLVAVTTIQSLVTSYNLEGTTPEEIFKSFLKYKEEEANPKPSGEPMDYIDPKYLQYQIDLNARALDAILEMM